MLNTDEQNLWMEVLLRVIDDALNGVRGSDAKRDERAKEIHDARDYLTLPSTDCDTVCSLAGVDVDALRERMRTKIADAPTPEQLLSKKPSKRHGKRLTFNGITRTITEWSDHLGIAANVIRARLKKGLPIEEVLSKKNGRGFQRKAAGVVQNFERVLGTGGGRSVQDSSKIDFSNNSEAVT